MRSSRISDATELTMLKACGSLQFSVEAGTFWAIFDSEFDLSFSGPEIEGTAPALTCRTVDVENLGIGKDVLVRGDGGFAMRVYRVVSDGTGQTILLLTK